MKWLPIIITIIIVSIYLMYKKKPETFQILGAAANYEKQYNQCLLSCSREDPSNAFSSPNNLMCGVYCDYVISEIINKGIPQNKLPLTNLHDKCETECTTNIPPGATHSDIRNCISVCYGAKRVSEYCEEIWCPYSGFDNKICMNQCTSTWGANNNQNAWTWGRFG